MMCKTLSEGYEKNFRTGHITLRGGLRRFRLCLQGPEEGDAQGRQVQGGGEHTQGAVLGGRAVGRASSQEHSAGQHEHRAWAHLSYLWA